MDTKVSEKKIAANRENAQKSTGPRTPRGKAIARLNAMTHGVFAKHTVLTGPPLLEEPKEFLSILEGLRSHYVPAGVYEDLLVQEIAAAKWKAVRLERYEAAGGTERLTAALESGRSTVAEERWTLMQKGLPSRVGSFTDPNESPMVTSTMLWNQIDLVERLRANESSIDDDDPDFLAFFSAEELEADQSEDTESVSEEESRQRLSEVEPKYLEKLKEKFRSRSEKLLEAMQALRAKTVPVETAIERSLVPDSAEIEKIIRYSTYLSRLEERKTELLEKLQKARRDKMHP